MDLRRFPGAQQIDRNEILSLWWYQPYFFADDLVSGVAGSWLMKGMQATAIQRADHPHEFDRFWRSSERLARMYQDWIDLVCAHSPVSLEQARVLEVACNTGYFLYALRQRGARSCVGIDQAPLERQRAIVSQITGITDIEFRRARYSSELHQLEGLDPSETFDIVIAVFIAQHLSDPLHFLRELARRTRHVLLFHTVTFPTWPWDLSIKYLAHTGHHEKWGDTFPNDFDTWMSRPLVRHALGACGFRTVMPIRYQRSWMPLRLYWRQLPVLCIR